MSFSLSPSLMDAVVLSIVSKEDTYGYKITQDMRAIIKVSESTLYPVLRRLQKNSLLKTYDQACDGRNRRYYSITSSGTAQLDVFRQDWLMFRSQVDLFFRR